MTAAGGWLDPRDRDLLAREWMPVAFAGDVGAAGGPHSSTLAGEPVVVYRGADGGVVVARDQCPHRGARLSAGAVHGGELACPYHGWRFGAGGACTRVPSQLPLVAIPPRAALTTIATTEHAGLVWACLEPGETPPRLPCWPEAADASFRLVHAPAQVWATSAGRQVENFLDVSHFPFVHAGTFGGGGEELVDDLDVEVAPDARRVVQRFSFLAANPEGSPLGAAATMQRTMTYEVDLPYASRLEIRYDDGRADVVLLASAPLTATSCTVYVTVARNYDHDRPAADLLAWDLAILEEDRPIIEGQRPAYLPLDLTAEVHVKSDRATIAYRRALRDLGFHHA